MDKKFILSRLLTVVFALMTVGLAILGPYLVDLVCAWYAIPRNTLANVLLVSGYACAAVAMLALYEIFRLLSSIAKGEIFSSSNVGRFRAMAILCAAAGVIALADCIVTRLYFLGLIGLSALFMGLLVLVVGDAFDSARRMKGELDLTI
jgi:cadmium resistance protein CadD (predicted permease)